MHASPFSTCTVMFAGDALEGLQSYRPESESCAFWMSSEQVVSSPFSMMTVTPPRGESYPIIWDEDEGFNGNTLMTRHFKFNIRATETNLKMSVPLEIDGYYYVFFVQIYFPFLPKFGDCRSYKLDCKLDKKSNSKKLDFVNKVIDGMKFF